MIIIVERWVFNNIMESNIFLSEKSLINEIKKTLKDFTMLNALDLDSYKVIDNKINNNKIVLRPYSIDLSCDKCREKLMPLKHFKSATIYKDGEDILCYDFKNTMIHFTQERKTGKFDYAYIFFFDNKLHCLQIPCQSH